MSEEKGIYVGINTYIGGAVHAELLKRMESAVDEYMRSENGQRWIRQQVATCIETEISSVLSYYHRDEPRAKALKETIIDAVYEKLFERVPEAKSRLARIENEADKKR